MLGRPFSAAKACSMASSNTCISPMSPWPSFFTALSPSWLCSRTFTRRSSFCPSTQPSSTSRARWWKPLKTWALALPMSGHCRSRRGPLLLVYAALVFVFIYLPVIVLILYSFNRDGVGGFPPRHLTLAWYRQLFADAPLWDAVANSLKVAAGSVTLSLTLGLLAALALDRASFPGKALFRRLVLLPLILPGIITGLSLLMFFVFVGAQLSLFTVFLGHGTALISVATTELFAGLQKMDRAQEEASLDLGATPWQTFWHVTVPNLKLSLIAAGLLIF